MFSLDEVAPGWQPLMVVPIGDIHYGVFMAAPSTFLGIERLPRLVKSDSMRYYEIRHFLRRCLAGDEKALQVLDQPEESFILLSDLGKNIRQYRPQLRDGDRSYADSLLIHIRKSQLPDVREVQAQLDNAKGVIRTIYRQVSSSAYRFGSKAVEKDSLLRTMDEAGAIFDEGED